MKFFECGCCGFYHKEGYEGDCRDNNERFSFWELENLGGIRVKIVTIEEQIEDENQIGDYEIDRRLGDFAPDKDSKQRSR